MELKYIEVMARREPAIDNTRGRWDVQVYRKRDDGELFTDPGQPFARFGWWSAHRPRRGQKLVTINCYKWKIVWLPDHRELAA